MTPGGPPLWKKGASGLQQPQNGGLPGDRGRGAREAARGMPMREVDTLVVGGGPAGSSCARELVRHGRECLVLERKAVPRVKLCAGWVTPKVLADLEVRPG